MSSENAIFRVWALDDVIYGPVPASVLKTWALDERLAAESWVFSEQTRHWRTAGQMPELAEVFGAGDLAPGEPVVRAGLLRRIKVLGSLNDEQLDRFGGIGQLTHFPAFIPIFKAGTPGDTLYFVLEGQVRLTINTQGREILISVQEMGGVFGQISLFDGLPRVTDAMADSPVTAFRVNAGAFHGLCADRPDIGAPVLLALGRTLAARIRSDDKHLCELVAMSQG